MTLPTDLLLELTRRYSEPHRHYHNLEHVARMLHHGAELALDDDQVLAIWFHDAVFEIPGPRNEELSAALAVERLTAAGLPHPRIAIVERIVLDTKAQVPTIEPARAVIDLDLAGFGAEWSEFCANTHKLRLERPDLSDADHRAANRRFFESVLARERIYWTEWGARREARARDNLRRALGTP